MAISVDPATKVISVPQADLTYVSPGLYSLSVEALRLWLKDWEDSEVGMSMPDTHRRNAPVTLSGATYAQTFEVINGYTITFEAGSYRVRMTGGNHNVGDVMNPNSVSIEVGNSAGLIVTDTGGGGGTAPTAGEIAMAVLAAMNSTPPGVDVKKVNGTSIAGSGNYPADPWRPA